MKNWNLLNRIDQYLLKNHPVIWRTRIHYIVIFSTLIGNIFAFVAPYLYPLTIGQLPTSNSLDGVQFISLLLAGFAVLFWGYKLSQYKLQSTSFKASMHTVLLYWLGCLSIALNLWVFNKTVEYKVGALIEYEQLVNDEQLLSDYSLGKAELEKSQIYELLDQYGISLESLSVKYPSTLTKDDRFSVISERIYFLKKRQKNNQGFLLKDDFQPLFFFTIVGLLALPMTGILFSLSSFLPVLVFLFVHFLFMVSIFNLWVFDNQFEEAYLVLGVATLLGAFMAFRRITITKYLKLFLMTVLPPMTFFYIVNNVGSFRLQYDVFPLLGLLGYSLLVTIGIGILTYWYQQSSLKPNP